MRPFVGSVRAHDEGDPTFGRPLSPMSGLSEPPMLAHPAPSRLRARVALGLLLAAALWTGRLAGVGDTALQLIAPAAGVAVAWLAPRRNDPRLWAEGLLLVVVTVAVMLLLGYGVAGSVQYAAGLLFQTVVVVGVLSATRPRLWTGRRLGRLQLADLWWFALAAAVGATAGTLVSLMGGADSLGVRLDLAAAVWGAGQLLGVLLIGMPALLLHHGVVRRPRGTSFDRALADALGVRPTVGWFGESAAVYGVSLVAYGLVFQPQWGAGFTFLLPLLAVWVGLRHPPLYKSVHALTVCVLAVVLVDPTQPLFVGFDTVLAEGLTVQALLVSITMSGLTLSVVSQDRAAALADHAHAEAEAHSHAELIRGVLDRLDDAVVVTGADGSMLYQNEGAVRLLGGTRAGVTVSRPDGRLLTGDDLPSSRALAGVAVEGEQLVLRSGAAPEGRSVQISGTPWVGDWPEGPVRAVTVVHDVSALQRQRDELEAFVGTVAHDLRNPTTVIEGWVEQLREMLDDGGADPRHLDDGLARIATVSQRMQELISGLLAWSTAQGRPVSPQAVDLSSLLTDVSTSHREASGAPSPPLFDIEALPVVWGDPMLLRQLFDNLVGNSVKYVAEGVVPRVRATAQQVGPGWTRVSVVDNGIGIPADLQRQIFDSFFRVDQQRFQGTGLGLRICRTIVERHGGSIRVSTPDNGAGTRFDVLLPLSRTVAEDAAERYVAQQ